MTTSRPWTEVNALIAVKNARHHDEAGNDSAVDDSGEWALIATSSANRDPARFPDPDRLDLAFGHGIHYCLGAALARMKAEVGLGASGLLYGERGFRQVSAQLSCVC